MKAIAVGVFAGGVLRAVFGNSPLNSTSFDVPRIVLGTLVGGMLMLIAVGISKLFQARHAAGQPSTYSVIN
jgi:hypothetical protein